MTVAVLDRPKVKLPCPYHGLGGGTAVHICEPMHEVIRKVQDVLNGTLSPEDAFPPIPEPPPPPPASYGDDPSQDTSPRRPGRLRANTGLPEPPPPTPSKRRVCAACKRRRLIKFFYVNLKAKGGRAIYCRKCWQERAAVRRKSAPDQHRAWLRQARKNYAETDKALVRNERYTLSYKGLLTRRLHAHKQRSRKKGVSFDLTKKDMKALEKKFFGRCAYCNEPFPDFNFDHVVPIQKEGPTCPANLVPACRTCNKMKGKKNIYTLLTSPEFSKRKRVERVLAHCSTARGAEKIVGALKRLMQEAGVGDPMMDLLEPWLREAVTEGFISKEDALVAMEQMGEEGLADLHEFYERLHRSEIEKDRREGVV